MKVDSRAEIVIPKPAEAVFDRAFEPEAFARRLKPNGPIPGLVSVEWEGGATGPAEGARRKVLLTDRSVMREEITRHARPYEHGYKWLVKPAFPFSLMVATAETTFRLDPVEGGTRVVWTYWFTLTSPLASLPMRGVVHFFRKWQQAALDALKTELA